MGKILAVLLIAAFVAGCKKKAPEQIPQPKAEAAAVAAPAAEPAAPAPSQNPLTAPGNYLKTTVGQVQKAKAAAAVYEDAAKNRADALDSSKLGGE
ncbi:MAG TPA: hypothetical protein DCW72_07705 [Elusimicrobia bacterium]|nr:MAG: hypothetical protein A2X29_05810 [Elusimicrobia bacterium GWA2_64_40]OGR67048.1 MAG: hypothetical protein A2X30_06180 [Elusimicrobia bacterium GWB2_63_16]HAU90097.1 hypothetical protein [Elusimicrobiota bacterium]